VPGNPKELRTSPPAEYLASWPYAEFIPHGNPLELKADESIAAPKGDHGRPFARPLGKGRFCRGKRLASPFAPFLDPGRGL
jgi:hypothetical protein